MTAKQKKKSKEFLDKPHGKKKSKAQEPKLPGKPLEESKPSNVKEPSRNELMLEAKAKGIKNFRVINKEELVEILKESTTQERINEIVSGAVTRWKAGWGKKKQKTEA